MKNVYLFDLDGTLTDSREGITKSVRYALHKMGKMSEDGDLKQLERFIGPPLKMSFSEFYGLDDEQCMEAIKLYRERYADVGIFENKLYEGVLETMKALKQAGKKVALATCKPEVFAVQICDKFGISPYLDAICGTTLSGVMTTKYEVIANALKELDAKAADAVMVGDRMHDIEGAKLHDMKSIGVTFGFAKEGELEEAGADYIVEKLTEIIDLVID